MPVSQRAAKEFIKQNHRHLDAPRGDLFRVGLAIDGELLAVGIAGRPCRMLQDGRTVELTRICSVAPGTINACSRIYGALIRAGRSLGYRRFITYTLESETGTSPKSAGFRDAGLSKGGEWNRPSRQRNPVQQSGKKRRWVAE